MIVFDMYPITYSWRKALSSTIILGVFFYLMFAAGNFYVAPQSMAVSENFLLSDVHYANHVLELNRVGLVPVDASDGIAKYVVRSGDSLGRIASKFGTTIAHLKKTNKITGTLRVGQELFVTEASGIIHQVKENTNFLVFANKYNLDLEDMMSLNYVVQENASITKGTELFLPITIEKAYDLGLEERPKPKPKPVLVKKPTPSIAKRQSQKRVIKTQEKPTATQKTKASPTVAAAPVPEPESVSEPVAQQIAQPVVVEAPTQPDAPYANKVVATWWDGSTQVSNGFYKGYCTYWAAKRRPDIFPYTSATTQSRPFGGNAKARLTNARNVGLATGNNPAIGAIAVFRGGGGGYGHVGIVIKIDRDRRLFLMEEMNGPSGKGYVNHRWISMDRGGVSGYIY